MMFTSLFLTFLAFTSAVFAAPSKTRATSNRCDVSKVSLTIPSSPAGTPLAKPLSSGPKFIGVALGVQNYTCGSTGTYTNVGAYAEIFDVSCLPSSSYSVVTDLVAAAWKLAPASSSTAEVIKELAMLGSPEILGQHYFITNPITGIGLSPKWDFTSASEKGHADAFVVGAKTGDIPAPTDPTDNIDYLSLSNVQGDLATQVFRMDTHGGQPPASCTPGSPEIFVKYASQYWFYGGSF